MNSGADGGSRVSIPSHLRKTIQSIREITGKQHSDEDIFAVYKESFNDPHETAQKLLHLDTFHEVRSKREKKKENLVPSNQGSGRSGRRNFASSYTNHDAGDGRSASFKRESRVKHVTGDSRTAPPAPNTARNLTEPRAIKVVGPNSLPNGLSNPKVQDETIATMNKELAEKLPLSKSTSSSEDIVSETNKAISEPVAAHVSISAVQNQTQDIGDGNSAQTSQPNVNNQLTELQPSTLGQHDPSLISASRCCSQSDQVTEKAVANKGIKQSLLKSDVGERSHVTFPLHLQVAKLLQNGLTFGSFDSNFVKEASSNNGASGGDDSNFVSSHGTGNDEEVSSPTTHGITMGNSAREGASSFSEDQNHVISNSASGVELALHDHNSSPVEGSKRDEMKEEALINRESHKIGYVQEAPLSVFGLVPSLSAFGQPVNMEAAETQPGNSNAPSISLVSSYPLDQSSIAASQQATHLFRQQYPPNFFPYGPYFSPYYMPPPYIHQFLGPNGLPQQSYFPPGAALASPSHLKSGDNTGNPQITNPSPHGSYGSSAVATHLPSSTTINSIHNEEKTAMTESTAAWAGRGLSNLQVGPMYNLALQGQPLAFPVVQAGHGGFMGIHQPTQPMAAASAPYQTLPPPPHTTTAMAEPIGHPHIAAYQQPQAALTNWVNNY